MKKFLKNSSNKQRKRRRRRGRRNPRNNHSRTIELNVGFIILKIIVIALLALLITTLTAKTVMTRIGGKESISETESDVQSIDDSSDYTITVTEYTGDTLEAEFDYENGRVMLYSIDSIDGSTFEQTGVEILTDTTYIGDYKKEQIGYITSLNLFQLNYSGGYTTAITSGIFYNVNDYLSGNVEDYYIDGTDWTSKCTYADPMYVYTYDETGSHVLTAYRYYSVTSAYPYSYTVVAVNNYYTPIEYSISFDSNGADSGEMESIEATYDEEYTLTTNAFTREGYTFTGWNTEADGSGTSYEDGATVSNLTTEDGDTVTLYAQWEEKEYYTIIFDGNGAQFGEIENMIAYIGEETSLPTEGFQKIGYMLYGWSLDGSKYTSSPLWTALDLASERRDYHTIRKLAQHDLR